MPLAQCKKALRCGASVWAQGYFQAGGLRHGAAFFSAGRVSRLHERAARKRSDSMSGLECGLAARQNNDGPTWLQYAFAIC